MARNDSFNQPWASVPAQFERPGDGLIARGWAGGASEDPPEAKWENWWHNRVDLALQELQNLGQLIWFTDAPYQAGARVSHGGNSYIALSENTGVEPTGSLDIGVWRKEEPGAYLQTANNLAEIAAAGPAAVAATLKNLTLTTMGIGLPMQPDIANFDWQNFAFISGANYVTRYDTWVTPPEGVTYNAGTRVSIRVIYISTINGPRMGLELTPDTGSAANFKVYKLLCVGAAGSRVFTFNQDWNSANPVPISGGGTGGATVAEALVNLGLGDGSLIPIGIPLPYPLSAAPTGWLKCNGSTFSTATYPKLALVYPSGVLPDMRGNAIRGWDDGRGVDAGRVLLSQQLDALQNITGNFFMGGSKQVAGVTATGAFGAMEVNDALGQQSTLAGNIGGITFDASRVARTAAETRMRNIAFNYIVRAI
nr:phage tail protein [Yersinia sp. KBS0713]